MAMPEELVLVRHGHSEGNLVVDRSKEGDNSFYTSDFRERPGHQWKLTEEGREQAKITGKWILENIGSFDRYYVSPYVRTRETAALLDLPEADWRIDSRVRERDWGDISSLPRSEFEEEYPVNAHLKKADSLYWRPPNGESIADTRQRVRDIFDTLHRETSEQKVLIVTHGEFMWATRAEIEGMTDEQWVETDNDKSNKIHNTQVIHYSKKNPHTGESGKYLSWFKSVCPWMEPESNWQYFERQTYDNQQLLEQVSLVEPLPGSESIRQ